MKESRDQAPPLAELARLIRWYILRSTTAAGSGHPTSCLSAVELMVALMFGGVFRANLTNPKYPNNDRLIFSKGHAAPLLYALYAAAGKLKPNDLLRLRKFGSPLEGHPMPTFRYTEFPTGSLGQGLSVGVGMTLAARVDKLPYRTYVLHGDSELSEGSAWEAIQLAAFRKLDNLVTILDVSRLGQSGPTMVGHNVETYARRVEAFGWKTVIIDGHNFPDILRAYKIAAQTKGRPTMIIAKTVKGKGVSFLENKNGWHGKALGRNQLKRAVSQLGPINKQVRGTVVPPVKRLPAVPATRTAKKISYQQGTAIAPRQAFGNALVRLAPAYAGLVVLDGEVKNSTFTDRFADAFPKRFIETFIAEQDMVGIASGLAARGKIPLASTFAAFFTRAFDQLRMLQYSGEHAVFVGSHPGVHIGQDGPSQMGLEDIALFRALLGSTILYPADAVATEKLMELALKASGVAYLRATRAALPVIYATNARFRIGGSTTLRRSKRDVATIAAAGVTLHEALRAADALANKKVAVRVIDLYSIQPIDAAALAKAARETRRVIVVEDHHAAGGMADAVRTALGAYAGTVRSLAAERIPRSGKPEQLLRYEGVDAAAIVSTVRKLTRA